MKILSIRRQSRKQMIMLPIDAQLRLERANVKSSAVLVTTTTVCLAFLGIRLWPLIIYERYRTTDGKTFIGLIYHFNKHHH